MDGIGDFRGTGLLTTIGGPAIIGLCIANFLGKMKINWYLLVPFIQGYVVIYTFIALFGLRLTIPFYQIALFIFVGSNLISLVLCQIVMMNTSYKKPKRAAPMTLGNILLGIVLLYVLAQAASIIIAYGFYSRTIDDCLDYIRCRANAPVSGFHTYSGALIFPSFLSGLGATWVYFTIFAMSPMAEKKG